LIDGDIDGDVVAMAMVVTAVTSSGCSLFGERMAVVVVVVVVQNIG